jgi:hypothetical protein
MCAGTCYTELVFLHPISSAYDIMRLGASRREMSRHYFSCSGEPTTLPIKGVLGLISTHLCFSIRCDLQVK